MGSIVSAYYDSCDEYQWICEELNISQRGELNFEHQVKIGEKLGVKGYYTYISDKIKLLKKEGWTIEDIKDFYKID